MKNIKSTLGKLNIYDFIKGLLVAIVSGVLTELYSIAENGSFTFDWQLISKVAIMSALGYLTKQLMTNSSGDILIKEKN